MGSTKSMNLFGTTFSDESSLLKEAETKYQKDIREAGDSPSRKNVAERGYQKSLNKIANDIMKKDSNLRLEFPFRLSVENKKKLSEHTDYYENDSVITWGNGGICIYCGIQIRKNSLYVDDDRSGVCSCIACANPDLDIDNDFYKVKIAE